jgi:threonine dehydrogenase-like Zn-dependent dehydrogenase
MRAAILRNKRIEVGEVPAPAPGPGEVLVKTLACGICGSDLHIYHQAQHSEAGGGGIVMGHEFVGEIVDYGPDTKRRLKPGTRVNSIPILGRKTGAEFIGYSDINPGGYGEFIRLTEDHLLQIPNGLATEHAALTEPMSVGWHAVNKARLQKGDVPLVIGCGPIGLAVIAGLKIKGAHPIVAASRSPKRRELALAMGADIVTGLAGRLGPQARGDFRMRRRPEDHRRDHGRCAAGRAHRRGRTLLRGRPLPADDRHAQGIGNRLFQQFPSPRIRRDAAPSGRRHDRRGAAGHRDGWARRRRRRFPRA